LRSSLPCSRPRPPNLGAEAAHIPARLVAKDIIPQQARIGAFGQSQQAAPLGARVVENLRQVASMDKEQKREPSAAEMEKPGCEARMQCK
jgi:hypothetical protein